MGREDEVRIFWLCQILIFHKNGKYQKCVKDSFVTGVKGSDLMFPIIDKRETGINLRRIMDKRGITVKDVQQYLGLGSEQSIYAWLNGRNMPTIDNLYALSELLRVSIDAIVRGNRVSLKTTRSNARDKRLLAYYVRVTEMCAA